MLSFIWKLSGSDGDFKKLRFEKDARIIWLLMVQRFAKDFLHRSLWFATPESFPSSFLPSIMNIRNAQITRYWLELPSCPKHRNDWFLTKQRLNLFEGSKSFESSEKLWMPEKALKAFKLSSISNKFRSKFPVFFLHSNAFTFRFRKYVFGSFYFLSLLKQNGQGEHFIKWYSDILQIQVSRSLNWSNSKLATLLNFEVKILLIQIIE